LRLDLDDIRENKLEGIAIVLEALQSTRIEKDSRHHLEKRGEGGGGGGGAGGGGGRRRGI